MSGEARTARVLVFRIGYFGDAVVALPALQSIRARHPSSTITMLTNDGRQGRIVASDVVPREFVDDYIYYGTDIRSRLAAAVEVRRRRFDLAYYLAPQVRTRRQRARDRWLFRLLGINRVEGLETSGAMSTAELRERAAEAEWSFLLRGAGSDDTGSGDCLLLTAAERDAANAWLVARGLENARLAAVAPFPAVPSKQWPIARYVTVMRVLIERGFHPLVVCGPGDAARSAELLGASGKGTATNGSVPVRVLGALLEHCAFYVGADTGAMHLAAAAGVRCVVIAAAMDARRRWDPKGEGHAVLRREVECEVCMLDVCPVGNRCLDAIAEDDVISALSLVTEGQR